MEYGNGKTNQLVWRCTENRYHNAAFDVDEDNLNVNVAMLSKHVQPGDTVLDIGCGEGKLGYLLRHKNCSLYGIDLDQEASEIALHKNGYQKVYQLNIEQENVLIDNAEFSQMYDQFDIVAIIDVLEHMINPTQAILNVLPVIKDKGKVLVSIPNINNADIVLNLLNDNFNYREAGVLDNTHTKFFTRSSFIQWIAEINNLFDFSLDCAYVGSTFGYTDFMEAVANEYPNVYGLIQLNPYFHVIQHLFVLTVYKQKDNSKLIDLKTLLNESSVNMLEALEKNLVSDNNEIVILPNERTILEEQIKGANFGWKKCAEELKHAGNKIIELEKALDVSNEKILELKETLKIADSFQKMQERIIQDKITELSISNKKIIEIELILDKAKKFQSKQANDIEVLKSENNNLLSEKTLILKKEEAFSQEFVELQKYAVRLEHDIDELKQYIGKLERDIEEIKLGSKKNNE